MLSAIAIRHIIKALDEATATLDALPLAIRVDHQIGKPLGLLAYSRDALLEAAIGDVAVERESV